MKYILRFFTLALAGIVLVGLQIGIIFAIVSYFDFTIPKEIFENVTYNHFIFAFGIYYIFDFVMQTFAGIMKMEVNERKKNPFLYMMKGLKKNLQEIPQK